MDARLVAVHETAGHEAMKLRRRLWWYLAAVLYIAGSLAAIPYIERFFSPFTFHTFGGPQ